MCLLQDPFTPHFSTFLTGHLKVGLFLQSLSPTAQQENFNWRLVMRLNHINLQLFLVIALAPTTLATTWYVNGVSGNNSDNCMSSQTACKTIGHAVSLASSGDSISVAAATYKEHLTITLSVIIVGSGAATTTIDGGGSSHPVIAVANVKAHVNLSNLTIRHGSAFCGGGVYNIGTLAIRNTIISGNHVASTLLRTSAGGGVCNSGIAMISNSTISGNSGTGTVERFTQGGGIFNQGTLTINKSTISGNSLTFGEGGGISNAGTATINNSTISGNDGYLRGGGILTGVVTAKLTINNSTISGNPALYGVGGIAKLYGSVVLQNSIVGKNSGGNCYGVLNSNGYNLSSDATCHFNNVGDLNNTDPKLGPLQNNGGPTTTMALPSGSPAIDAGNPSGCNDGHGRLLTTDQRGMPRPDKEDTAGCDMGAYEYQSPLEGGIGKCVVTDAKLSGYCIGTRGGVCREAYDPTNCPPQTPVPNAQANKCAQSLFRVDPTRGCTP